MLQASLKEQFEQVQKIWSTFGAGMVVGFLFGVIVVLLLLVVVYIAMSVFFGE